MGACHSEHLLFCDTKKRGVVAQPALRVGRGADVPGPKSGVYGKMSVDREGIEVRRSCATVPSVVPLLCGIF